MTQLWQTVLAIIGSVGGAGIIISFVVKFASEIIADKLSQRYELRLNKELEKYKSRLDKKTHVSRARFDMEFSIYSKLSEAFYTLVSETYWLFPNGVEHIPFGEEDYQNYLLERTQHSNEAISKAGKVLGANAPFIPAEFYESFNKLRELCVLQYSVYLWYGPGGNHPNDTEEYLRLETECRNRTKTVLDSFNSLIARLREYLEKLEVVEGT